MPSSRETPETTTSMPATKPRSIWRNWNYVLLWSGQTISNFGTQASQLAFPLLVLLLTHSAAQAGFVGALRLVPYIFLSLPVGALVDRWNRKNVMIICDAIRALALGSIPFTYITGHLTLVQIYAVSFIEGSLYVFFNLAQSASLPQVVAKEQLPEALGQNQAAEGASIMLGPPLGGALFGLNQLLPFLADAISYAVSVISLLFIKVPFQEKREVKRRNIYKEVAEGVVFVWQQPLLRYIALRSCVVNFSYSGASLLVIVLAQNEGASASVIGLILAIAGVGSIVGSLLASRIQKRFSYGQVMISITWSYFLFWTLYLTAFTPLLLGIFTAILFINRPITNVVNISYRVALVSDALLGRISSFMQLLSWSSIPLSISATGILLQQFGATFTILFFSCCLFLISLITTFNPHVRHAPPLSVLIARQKGDPPSHARGVQ